MDPESNSKSVKQPKTAKLKEVAIPTPRFKAPHPLRKRSIANSPSSASSLVDSVQDQMSEYDTPGTSAAVTPAETSALRNAMPISAASTKKVSASARALELRSSAHSLSTSVRNRKRQAQDSDEDGSPDESSDARLARRLQAEEYSGKASKRTKMASSNNKYQIDDSIDDDDDDLEFITSISDSESDVPLASSRRKAPVSSRFSLPSRAARDSARKSINKKITREVPDSDESALSSVESDIFDPEDAGSDLGEDFYEVDSDGNPISDESSDADGAPTIGIAASSNTPQVGRRRTWRSRFQEQWSSRVGSPHALSLHSTNSRPGAQGTCETRKAASSCEDYVGNFEGSSNASTNSGRATH